MSTATESNLVRHAREELNRAGMFDADADYGGMVADCVMELVKLFASQGHSGGSAEYTLFLFTKVASFHVLTPITSDPAEWMFIDKDVWPGPDVWQNRRQSSFFSDDAGKTWYNVDDTRTWPWRMRLRKWWGRMFS